MTTSRKRKQADKENIAPSVPEAANGYEAINATVHMEEPASKRPRLETLPPLESLPSKAIQEILRFVGSPKTIFSLVTHIKAFHQVLEPGIVVEAAFWGDKRSRRIITSIINQIKSNQIYAPSATRLLRLLTLQHCERGDECCGLNLETRVPRKLLDTSNKKAGIYQSLRVCGDCCNFLTMDMMKGVYYYKSCNFIKDKMGQKLPLETLLDCTTGEKIGPHLLASQADQHKTHLEFSTSPKKPGKARAALSALLNELPEDEDSQLGRYAILKSYNQLLKEETRREEMKEERRERKLFLRDAKARATWNVLENQLGELVRFYPFLFECDFDDTGTVKFPVRIIDNILGPIIRKTSQTLSKPKLSKTICTVVDTVINLENLSFLGKERLTFLDPTDATQAAMKIFFGTFSESRLFLKAKNYESSYERRYGRATFVELIQSGNALDALATLLLNDRYGFPYSSRNEDYKEFFCFCMLDEMGFKPSNKDQWERYKKLASATYDKTARPADRWEHGAYAELKRHLLLMRSKFNEYMELIRLYRMRPETKSFLKFDKKYPSSYTRKMAVYSIFELKYSDHRLLMEKNFDALLANHGRLYYQTP